MEDICNCVRLNPAQTNFVESERILRAGLLIKCGKNVQNDVRDYIEIVGFCLQPSILRGTLHEINGLIIFVRVISNVQCKCKAGLGKK